MVTSCSGPNWDEITQKRDQIVSHMDSHHTPRMQASATEIGNRREDFPIKYTQALDDERILAERALTDIGNSENGWIAELNTAITNKDKKAASTRIDSIVRAMQVMADWERKILGPPNTTGQGYYDGLAANAALVPVGFVNDQRDFAAEVTDLKKSVEVTLSKAEKFKLCGTESTMSYKDAWSKYGSGVSKLSEAEAYLADTTQHVMMYDGTQVVDTWAAGDALLSAYTSFSGASGDVSAAPNNHTLASDAIKKARELVDDSESADGMWYADYHDDVASYHDSGVDNLGKAEAACTREEFSSAVSLAQSAEKDFNNAVYWSTQEETVVVVDNTTTTQPETSTTTTSSEDTTIIPEITIDDSPQVEVYDDSPVIEVFEDSPDVEVFDDAPETDYYYDGDSRLPGNLALQFQYSNMEVANGHIA